MIQSLNQVILIGNVGREPIVGMTENNTKKANFSLATSQNYVSKEGEQSKRTDWHNIIAYRHLADLVESCIRKGIRICIIGKAKASSWEDKKTGEKKTSHYIEVSDLFIHPNFATLKNMNGSPSEGGSADEEDDDIPF